jgi:hypothetical protein
MFDMSRFALQFPWIQGLIALLLLLQLWLLLALPAVVVLPRLAPILAS